MQLGSHPDLDGFQDQENFSAAVGILTTCHEDMQKADSRKRIGAIYRKTMMKIMSLKLNVHDHQRVSSCATSLMEDQVLALGADLLD